MSDQELVDTIIGEALADDATIAQAMPGRYYTDPQLHRLEVEQVFGHEWSYLCHQSQLPNPGDYFCDEIGEEPIYAMRGRDNEIRGFYNVCQHRGHQLLTGQGSIPSVVVCPYHAWSYDMEGALRGAPKSRQVTGFCKDDVKLSPVRLEVIAGFIFVNLDDDASSMSEMAPDFAPSLTSMIAEADQLQFVKKRGYDINANWKVVVENFLEAYHVEFSGPAHQALGTIIDIDTYQTRVSGRIIEYTAQGGSADTLPYDSNESDAFTNAKASPFHQIFLYPHMTFSVFPGTNMLFVFNMRPNGPEKCAEEIIYFALDADLSEPSQSAEEYVSLQLNHEDVSLVEAVHRGLRSKGYRPGRLMVDKKQEEGWSEHFVHHFNQLNVAALRRDHGSP